MRCLDHKWHVKIDNFSSDLIIMQTLYFDLIIFWKYWGHDPKTSTAIVQLVG